MSIEMVKNGVVVSMEYTLHVDDREVGSSKGKDPLEFIAGHGNIISGLEREMIGMKVGESKDVVVPPKEGYGELDEKAVMEVPLKRFPKDMKVAKGLELTVKDEKGQSRYARVDKVADESARLNFNHPLAGNELHFKVRVVNLREATKDELKRGRVHVAGGIRQ